MRIIVERRIDEFCQEYPDAANWLKAFKTALKAARWENIHDVRRAYPHADAVLVESGRTVTVFNARGNRYRLVLALHYNKGWAYVLRFMPHQEYSRRAWKKTGLEENAMSQAAVRRQSDHDRYLELILEFPLRPIRSKADYRRAAKVIDRLAAHDEGILPRGEQDYLDTLSLLIEDYDRACRLATQPVDPLTLLRHLMEETGMTVTALGGLLGGKSVASEVLHGKRSLSKSHILKLADRFKLDAGAFLG